MIKNVIFALVGTSGSGKSTIMKELLSRFPEDFFVIKTTTSRDRRGDEDDLFYNFEEKERILQRKETGDLVQYAEYAGNAYCLAQADIEKAVGKGIGIQAFIESAISDLIVAGFRVYPIKILTDRVVFREANRVKLDEERARIPVDFVLTINNSFKSGGLDRAVQEIADFADALKKNQI